MDFPAFLLFLSLSLIIAAECKTLKRKLTIDREHLKLDFLNLFGFSSWSDILSDAEMDFRYFIYRNQDLRVVSSHVLTASNADSFKTYFKSPACSGAHDRDNNKKLDGLELFTALEHDAKHDEEAHDGEPSTTEDIEKEVEAIFLEHDKNGDGYLEYKEFMTVHKTHPDISGERRGNPKHPEL